jgi:neopullulanase
LRGLPKFNTSNPEVREYLWGVAEHWIREGVDGWRLDVPEEINDREFWQEFRRRVKQANPEAFLVGEIWRVAPEWVEGDRFDSLTNYPFTRACLGTFLEKAIDAELLTGHGLGLVPRLEPEDVRESFLNLQLVYTRDNTGSMLNLLSSHDIPRFLTFAGGDESALRMAALLQMTYPGAPCVYYGDEIGMQGGRDPDCRRAFPWDEGQWNRGLRQHYKAAIALRKAHPALRRGDLAWLGYEDSVLAFARKSADETLVIVFNLSREPRTTAIMTNSMLAAGSSVRDVSSGHSFRVQNTSIVGATLAARSGTVFLAEP